MVLYIITQNDKILFSFINNYRVKWYFSSISSQNPRNICIVGIDSNELLHSRYERHLQLTVFHEDLLSLQFALQPTKSIISTAEVYLQQRALKYDIDNLESCFDDLRTTKGLAEAYLQSENGTLIGFQTGLYFVWPLSLVHRRYCFNEFFVNLIDLTEKIRLPMETNSEQEGW